MTKRASADHPIHELISDRWSPYGFSDRPVSQSDLCGLFEAVRWSASSYNEQPWSFIVAAKDKPDRYEEILSCLLEGNQGWAGQAPVLMIAVASMRFSRNNKPNRVAIHDLGLAAATLTFEATARGLAVHQMAGILPDKARVLFAIPEGHDPITALAVGYAEAPESLPDALKERDSAPRTRKPLSQFVFEGKWGDASAKIA